MPTAHAEQIALARPDPWADERGETLKLLAQCAPGQANHQLYRKLLQVYDELFQLRATAAGLKKEAARINEKEGRNLLVWRMRARRWKRAAKRSHKVVRVSQENAERWERIALQFADRIGPT